MSVIEELEAAVATVVGRAGPAVVGIGSRQRGSGVVIAAGQVVTNAHNLRGEEVTVVFRGGRRATGRVQGVDPDGDLAVIAVDTGDTAPLDWAPGGQPALGRVVFGASATPDGGTRVTTGLVSAVERTFRGPRGMRISGSIEHTAPLAPGSSGGPILDGAGRMVGLNTNRIGEGFYLAIPADDDLRARVGALSRGESPSRPRLGIAVAPAHVARRLRRSVGLPELDGLLVRGVEEGSPAARAGMVEGDLIVAAGGRTVETIDDLQEILAGTGLPIEVELVRGTDERTLSVGGEVTATGEA
jgi:serine protease Do